MSICIYCRINEVSNERVEAGYLHCAERACVREWRRGRLTDYAVVMLPKAGARIIERDQLANAPTKSSGR